ncbi:MAG: histidine phosphatase family protein, partial [Chloroflexota bacterium]
PLFLDFYTPFHSMGETGEGNWELFLRAGKALAKILKRPPGQYLVVSHGGILNQVVCALVGVTPQANDQGARFHFVNAAFATIDYDPEIYKWTVFGLNDFTHLGIKSSELGAEEAE